MTDTQKIERLKIDPAFLTSIYEEHRSYALRFMRKMNGDEDVILDLYQDAIIVLYENSKKPEFALTCSIQTYINSICRNQLLKRFKENSRFLSSSDEFNPEVGDWFEDETEDLNEERISALQKGLEKLKSVGGNCYDILVRYFFHKESMNQIAEALGYTNGDNVKNQKARCQKKLRELTFQHTQNF